MTAPPAHIAHWKPCKSFRRFSDALSVVTKPRVCYNFHWRVHPHHKHQKHSRPAPRCYRETMLVTWYDNWGLMADGVETYPGAAAGGYDLPLGAHVSVPGVGQLVVHDREGARPWAHIDVFVPNAATASSMGLGADHREVTVCP